ncbi:MAG: hypothetical protein ACXAEF_11715 [Candidatus Thorarchaeota archaeon]|jgi:ribosomal protein L32
MTKDSDWAWAYEDNDPHTSSSVRDTRRLGSDDEPKMKHGNFSKCKACGSNATIVVFHKSGANADGLVVEEELLCKTCGKYTQYRFDDRS